MLEAPRVLIALRPRMYAEVLAFSVGRDRPRAEVSVLDPSEDLEEAAVRLRPHPVVADRVPEVAREEGHLFWVEVNEPHANEGIEKLPGTSTSAEGYSESVREVRTEHVLGASDRAEEWLIPKGRSRLRGTGASS
jgi:hypothetical protein